MERMVEKVFRGYNNCDDLQKRFYDDLSQRLRNEPNKVGFLNNLKKMIKIECTKHSKKCKEKEECNYPKLRDVSIKIIDSITIEEKKKHSKSWFKENVNYMYYTLAVIGFVYAFIKWIYPYLID